MCGRYATSRGAIALAEAYRATDETGDAVTVSWNVAPTMPVPVVLVRPDAQTVLRSARWGLVPPWSKDLKGGARMINARSESVATTAAFRKAFASKRCLVPVDGWYEWRKPARTPFFLGPADPTADAGGLTLAGLYELWRDPAREADDPARWVFTCTILTAAAPEHLAWLHDRVPVVLTRGDQVRWLESGADVSGLLHGPADGVLTVHEVSTRVNAVRNDGPDLLDPPSTELPAAGTQEQPTLL